MELFFNALGLGLLNSIWQMAILYSLYKLLCNLWLQSPAGRFRLGLLLTLLGSGIFLFSIVYFIAQPNPTHIYSFESFIDIEIGLFKKFIILSGAGYAGIFFYALFKNIFHFFQFKNSLGLINNKVPVVWRHFVQKEAAFMEIRNKVQVVCTKMTTPATYGWLKPVVLLPVSCLTGLDSKSIEALLLHELAHIKRNDYLWHMLLAICETLLYPNTLMRMLIQDTRLESEKACDNVVLQFGYPAPLYANALLHIAKTGQHHSVALAAKGTGNLLHRVKSILSLENSKNFNLRFLAAVLVASGICFVTSISRFNHKNAGDSTASMFNTSNVDIFTQQDVKKIYTADWKGKILSARLLIFKNRLNKSRITVAGTTKEKFKNEEIIKEQSMAQMVPPTKKNEATDNQTVVVPNPVFINAGWAEKVTAEVMDNTSPLFKSKELFTQLLEKLEYSGTLEDKEWTKLLSLVNFYYHIGEQIYDDENAASTGLAETKEKQTRKVLLIIYDENNGLITAYKMDAEQIKAFFEVDPNDAINNQQQAILLHRKKNKTKAEIKL
jgi:hypothetical protein